MAKEKDKNLDRIQMRPVADLKNWDKNPRAINKDRFAELKKSIEELGFNDVLKVTPDNVVIGGNMRLRALQELGYEHVPVIVVEAKDDKEIFKIALRDNEEFGYYEEQAVAELALRLELTPVELKAYEIHLGKPRSLDLVMADFGAAPGIELPNEAREGYQQMTFIVSDQQADTIMPAIKRAKKEITGEEDNDNSNGCALFYLAKAYGEEDKTIERS